MKSLGLAPRSPNVIAIALLLLAIGLAALAWISTHGVVLPMSILVVGFVLMRSPQVAEQWERGVVLRLGRFRGAAGTRALLGTLRADTVLVNSPAPRALPSRRREPSRRERHRRSVRPRSNVPCIWWLASSPDTASHSVAGQAAPAKHPSGQASVKPGWLENAYPVEISARASGETL